MSYQFCDFSEEDKDQLKQVFETPFKIDESGFYKIFKEDFAYQGDAKEQKEELKLVTIERNEILPKTDHEGFIKKYESKEYRVGIDLPILLRPEKPNGKTIFFVAEDPLRNFDCDNVILATPFGVHVKYSREKTIKKVYWQVMGNLLDKGYSVYVTDTFKIWVSENGKKKKEMIPNDLFQHFTSSLQKEIDWLKPNLIVCYGNPAYRAVCEVAKNHKGQILHFPHPAAWADDWKKEFKNNSRATHENKIKHINTKIENTLSMLSFHRSTLSRKVCN